MTRPTELNYVTCEYGVKGSWAAGYHTGIDYRAPVGTEIFATRGGKVVQAGWGGSYGPAYGNTVVLQTFYRGKSRQVLYAHLSAPRVKVGQRVKAGELIGISGETGNTNGPHLHYEERFSPYSYWDHYKPVFPSWQPKNRNYLKKILKRVGIKK